MRWKIPSAVEGTLSRCRFVGGLKPILFKVGLDRLPPVLCDRERPGLRSETWGTRAGGM